MHLQQIQYSFITDLEHFPFFSLQLKSLEGYVKRRLGFKDIIFIYPKFRLFPDLMPKALNHCYCPGEIYLTSTLY